MDPLFPALPEDLTALTDEELQNLLDEHNAAGDLIDANDEDFIKGMAGDEVTAAYEQGVAQIEQIEAEQKARADAVAEYEAKIAELSSKRKPAEEPTAEVEETEETEAAEETAEVLADATTDEPDTDEVVEEEEEAAVPVAASARRTIRPPAPSREREPATSGATLTAAAGLQEVRAGLALGPKGLADLVIKEARRRGRPSHHAGGVEERILLASAQFPFPEDRRLDPSDYEGNMEKIRKVIPASVPGMNGYELTPSALTASGGLCAPLTPIYSMPNFATEDRPVRDALPSFNADRGGVNVPTPTYIGDIDDAITVITETEDAQGGTFATKSCQDLECPQYTEVPVTIISHCREYGNLVARSWPEKIRHENELTMAAHARTAETYLLDRIKALSINVTNGADTLGAMIYFVDAVTRAKASIRYNLRTTRNARYRVLAPAWLLEVFELDQVQNQFDRYRTVDQMLAYLNSLGIAVTWYLDNVTGAVPFAAETAGTIDDFPDTVQWAMFPEGAFIHVDGGALELGLVRDSTLNSTNDFQMFGETFENVALLAPAQATRWITSDLCPNGQFPPAGTARTCA